MKICTCLSARGHASAICASSPGPIGHLTAYDTVSHPESGPAAPQARVAHHPDLPCTPPNPRPTRSPTVHSRTDRGLPASATEPAWWRTRGAGRGWLRHQFHQVSPRTSLLFPPPLSARSCAPAAVASTAHSSDRYCDLQAALSAYNSLCVHARLHAHERAHTHTLRTPHTPHTPGTQAQRGHRCSGSCTCPATMMWCMQRGHMTCRRAHWCSFDALGPELWHEEGTFRG